MIHNANNIHSAKYAPSYSNNQSITSSKQKVYQPSSHSIVQESNNGGIDSIMNEIENGYRLPNSYIPIISTSYLKPVYDNPKSVFTVSETLDPNDFQPIVSGLTSYLKD
jgi:hypothetical protein